MSRLPTPGSDRGNWGSILNDFLLQAHNPDGSLKNVATQAVFSRVGTLNVANGRGRYYVPSALKIKAVVAAVGTVPQGAAIVCDVNLNGKTIFPTGANRPFIPAGALKVNSPSVPSVTTLAAGDLLSVDVDQVGSAVAGADLSVIVLLVDA